MHADLKQLLSHRDGEPNLAQTADHIANCPKCAAEVEQLDKLRSRLQALPAVEPPEHAWMMVRASLAAKPLKRRSWGFAAAVVVGALAVLPLFWLMRQEKVLLPVEREMVSATGAEPSAAVATNVLVSRSQQLEHALDDLPARPAVERVATSATIDALQQRIQMLDSELFYGGENQMDDEQAQRLWGERVELLSSLVNVRFAEAARAGYLSMNTMMSGEYR